MTMTVELKSYEVLAIDYTRPGVVISSDGGIAPREGEITAARLTYHVRQIGSSSYADILREVHSSAAATIEGATLSTVELASAPRADCV